MTRAEHFQFPFHRDWLCDRVCPICRAAEQDFQFPFHRDWLCDLLFHFCEDCGGFPFSSLFIGIGFVTAIEELEPVVLDDLSVPFSSGLAL